MSSSQTGREELVYCRELNTGQSCSGTIVIKSDSVVTNLYSFDGAPRLDERVPIYLQTERGEVVSLFENAVSMGVSRGPAGSCWRSRVHSELAVIGPDAWQEHDLVKWTSFTISNAMGIFSNPEQFKKLKWSSPDHSMTLLQLHVGDVQVGVCIGGSYDFYFDEPRENWPIVTIESEVGVSSKRNLERIQCVLQLLSMSKGQCLAPSNIHISRLTEAERSDVGASDYPAPHVAEYAWADQLSDDGNIPIHRSFVSAHDEHDLAALESCIAAWIRRDDHWRGANMLMMKSLSLKNTLTAERLLNACKWLEEIPYAQFAKAIPDEDLEIISAVAVEKACELGYEGLRNRVMGTLKTIRSESNEQRLARLVDFVRERFAVTVFREGVMEDLRLAMKFRGRVAHSHFSPDGDKEAQQFYRSTLAVEALCFLLTLRELPISKRGEFFASECAMVRDYRLA